MAFFSWSAEETQRWLYETFLPEYERLLDLKKRGLIDAKVRRNLNGSKSLL